ncbi:unnamed protein product [Caenorhabditis angaria]|uniref:MGS-like domain-containing protein n=1 Tax=Caenorhabditis angaria TaxID=860376 RepID=A0A9P1N322_9PELO|nr:unnamed protein product [Caenorhabditis angaria]
MMLRNVNDQIEVFYRISDDNINEWSVCETRHEKDIRPCVKQIDTVAGEWPTQTNYLYTTFNGVQYDVEFNMKNAVMVLGSGVYRIGSSVEFDSSCVGCIRELKSLFSTVFVVPKKNIFISIGGYHAKAEMLKSVEILQHLGYELYGSKGTADYFKMNKINVKPVDWPFEEGSSDEKMASGSRSVVEFLENKEFHLVINLPIRGSGAYRVSAFRTRRMAVDNGIPLITDIKCVHLVKIPFSFQTIFRYLSIHLINVV